MQKMWFITGASRGFGRTGREAILQRGDRVAATARDVTSLASLKGVASENGKPCGYRS